MDRPGELMTIKAFSEAAGRSQQAIYKQIGTRLASYVHEKDGQKYIERRALDEVFKIGEIQPIQPEKLNKSPEENNLEQRLYASMQATIDLLQEQIKVKDQQIDLKDKQLVAQLDQLSQLTAALEHTTTSLQAAQALHAGTMQHMLPGAETPDLVTDDKPKETDDESGTLIPENKEDQVESTESVVRGMSWRDIFRMKFSRRK